MDCLRNSTIVPFTSSAHGEGDYLRGRGVCPEGKRLGIKKPPKGGFLGADFATLCTLWLCCCSLQWLGACSLEWLGHLGFVKGTLLRGLHHFFTDVATLAAIAGNTKLFAQCLVVSAIIDGLLNLAVCDSFTKAHVHTDEPINFLYWPNSSVNEMDYQ